VQDICKNILEIFLNGFWDFFFTIVPMWVLVFTPGFWPQASPYMIRAQANPGGEACT
jgi:hypothetical protein